MASNTSEHVGNAANKPLKYARAIPCSSSSTSSEVSANEDLGATQMLSPRSESSTESTGPNINNVIGEAASSNNAKCAASNVDDTTPSNVVHITDASRLSPSAVEYNAVRSNGNVMVILESSDEVLVKHPSGFLRHNKFQMASSVFDGYPKLQKMLRPKKSKDAGLPAIVDYILDLQVQLNCFRDDMPGFIANLLCPKSFLGWHVVSQGFNVSHTLVKGADDEEIVKFGNEYYLKGTDPSSADNPQPEKSNPTSLSDIKQSHEEFPALNIVRIRAGIDDLLGLIAGADGGLVNLDSAHKVWTLARVAEHFGCAEKVADKITGWFLSGSNIAIFEVAPESCLGLGLAINATTITRKAFSVLVSEAAVARAKAFSDLNSEDAVAQAAEGWKKKEKRTATELGRHIDLSYEPADNITSNIQSAADLLIERVRERINHFTEESMTWMEGSSEFQKLIVLSQDVGKPIAKQVMEKLRKYVRMSVMKIYLAELNADEVSQAVCRRRLESWLTTFPGIGVYHKYEKLVPLARSMTRFFWQKLARFNFFDKDILANSSQDLNAFFEQEHVQTINHCELTVLVDILNQPHTPSVGETTTPQVAGTTTQVTRGFTPHVATGQDPLNFNSHQGQPSTLNSIKQNVFASGNDAIASGGKKPSSSMVALATPNTLAAEKPDWATEFDDSLKFNMTRCLDQLTELIHAAARQMLDRGEDGFSISEGLTDLSEEEYSCLPLLVGGENSGADNRPVPLTLEDESFPPGPIGEDAAEGFTHLAPAQSITTTIQVENGYSDHIDRRRVVGLTSEFGGSGFTSVVAPSEMGDATAKGKGEVKGTVSSQAGTDNSSDFEKIHKDEAQTPTKDKASNPFETEFDSDDAALDFGVSTLSIAIAQAQNTPTVSAASTAAAQGQADNDAKEDDIFFNSDEEEPFDGGDYQL